MSLVRKVHTQMLWNPHSYLKQEERCLSAESLKEWFALIPAKESFISQQFANAAAKSFAGRRSQDFLGNADGRDNPPAPWSSTIPRIQITCWKKCKKGPLVHGEYLRILCHKTTWLLTVFRIVQEAQYFADCEQCLRATRSASQLFYFEVSDTGSFGVEISNISPDLFGRCKLIAHTLDHAVCNSNLGNWCRLLEILRWEYGEKWKCIWQFPSKTSNNKQNHLTQKDGVYDSPMSFAAFSFMTAVMAESWLCSLRWWTQTCFCLRNLGMETGGKNANVVLQGCSCYSRFQIECSWALKHWVLQWEIKDSDSRWQLGVDCSSRDRGRRFWKFNMAQCRLQPKSIQSCATVSTSKAKRLNLMFVYLNLT